MMFPRNDSLLPARPPAIGLALLGDLAMREPEHVHDYLQAREAGAVWARKLVLLGCDPGDAIRLMMGTPPRACQAILHDWHNKNPNGRPAEFPPLPEIV